MKRMFTWPVAPIHKTIIDAVITIISKKTYQIISPKLENFKEKISRN